MADMTRTKMFEGGFCRIIRTQQATNPPQYLIEVPDGVDALGVARWKAPTAFSENVFQELAAALDPQPHSQKQGVVSKSYRK